jgi:hypothetical protein
MNISFLKFEMENFAISPEGNEKMEMKKSYISFMPPR